MLLILWTLMTVAIALIIVLWETWADRREQEKS